MKRKLTLFGLVVFVILGWTAYFFISLKSHLKGPADIVPVPRPEHTLSSDAPCPGDPIEVEMKDPYMRGIIEKGRMFRVLPNWYACHPLVNGEYVYYRYSTNREPVARIVRAKEGDRFELVADPTHKAWNIKINGKLLESDGKPHFFGGEPPPPLSLYEKSRKGLLGKNEAIVFSSSAPGDIDSGVFGLVNVVDLIGKVELIK